MKKIIVLALMVLTALSGSAFAVDSDLKIKITVNGKTLTATLEDNPTSRAFISKLPFTLPMMDLYGREKCYRFDDALPTGKLTSSNYKVGDIAYWPTRHSFVILYEQNGERFQQQQLIQELKFSMGSAM